LCTKRNVAIVVSCRNLLRRLVWLILAVDLVSCVVDASMVGGLIRRGVGNARIADEVGAAAGKPQHRRQEFLPFLHRHLILLSDQRQTALHKLQEYLRVGLLLERCGRDDALDDGQALLPGGLGGEFQVGALRGTEGGAGFVRRCGSWGT
jgi:hypothetical protein